MFLHVLISFSSCLTSSFTSHFFCIGCLIWRSFVSVKSSSYRPCFDKIMRSFSVMEFVPFVSDLVLGSSRCARILAAFIATLEFGVWSTEDNRCWFSISMNWKSVFFLLRTMKRGFQLTTLLKIVYFEFKIMFDKFRGVKGDCSDCWGRGIRLSCVGQYVCFGCCQ